MWGRIVSSVSSALDINLATLSGCIDVLAVPQADGSLRSSPFHVRFGKAKLLRSREKEVTITVNGILIEDVTLTLGAAGEAFFVEEIPEGDDGDASPVADDFDLVSPHGEFITGDSAKGSHLDAERIASPTDVNTKDGKPRVQFSLCGDILFGTADEVLHDEAVFSNNTISWEALEADPSLWFNPALVARFDSDGPVYPSKVALPLICSWVAFKKPISLSAVQKLMASSLTSAPIEDPSYLSWVYNGSLASTGTGTGTSTSTGSDPSSTGTVPNAEPPHIQVKCVPVLVDHTTIEVQTPQHASVGDRYGVYGDATVKDAQSAAPSDVQDLHTFQTPVLDTATDTHHINTQTPVHANIDLPLISPPPTGRSTISAAGNTTGSTTGNSAGRITPHKVRPRTSSIIEAVPVHGVNEGDGGLNDIAVVRSAHQLVGEDRIMSSVWVGGSPFCLCYQPGYSAVPTSTLTKGQSKRYRKTLRPTADQLASMQLKEGVNCVVFTVTSPLQGTKTVSGSVYLWRRDAKIIVSDVDGTITRSDVLGQLMPIVGRDWSHLGVADLFSKIRNNGYQILYLTARAIGQADSTRDYLFGLRQNDEDELPDGPLILSPDRLFNSFKREVIDRKPYVFKIAALRDLRSLFPPQGNPFVAGFGNREADHRAYVCNGIPEGKVFIIDKNGVVHHINRAYAKTYESMSSICESMFPPLSSELGGSVFKCTDEQFNSFNFWALPYVPLCPDASESFVVQSMGEDFGSTGEESWLGETTDGQDGTLSENMDEESGETLNLPV